MPSWKAFLPSLLLAAASLWAVQSGGARVESLRAEMAALDAAGRAEGESFLKTLEGDHADRQLAHFDRRRELALQQARARRDELLGVFGLVGSALLLAGGALLRRIRAEVEAGPP
jgi:hypothetical protein